jgi:hypothetical protein
MVASGIGAARLGDGVVTADLRQAFPAPTQLHVCATCVHYRLRPRPRLFGQAELQSPGGLKAETEWQQQERQHAERESQLLAAGLPFTYEPHHYAWCDAFTRADLARRAGGGDQEALAELIATRAGRVNPVTGEVTPFYALCARMNPEGRCERYERNGA